MVPVRNAVSTTKHNNRPTEPIEHSQPDVSQRSDEKPEVILAYNKDDGGVDAVDKMFESESVSGHILA